MEESKEPDFDRLITENAGALYNSINALFSPE